MTIRRYAALATILAGGACSALPFARSGSSPARQQPHRAADVGPADAAGARLELPQIAVETRDGDPPAISPAPSFEAELASWAAPIPLALPRDDEPLPMLPHVPVASRASRAAHIEEPDFDAIGPTQAPAATSLRRHRIVDGDSLSRLALRYLGDESRSTEIAALNQHVIRDPHLLPVGREIVIPAGE